MTKGFSATLAIFGLILFAFGFIAIASVDMTAELLITYLAYMLVAAGGIACITGILIRKSTVHWIFTFCMGVLALFLGAVISYKSEVAAQYYTFFIAVFAALMGGSLIVLALYIERLKILLVVQGLLSIAFGLMIYFNPFESINTLNFMVGCYTIVLSVVMVYASYRISRPKKKEEAIPPAASAKP
jgi:uncharacterized membrane protein HdeD (DUF308 family)